MIGYAGLREHALEQGQVLPAAYGWWEYIFRAEGRILVVAMDLPGNVTCQKIGWNTAEAPTS